MPTLPLNRLPASDAPTGVALLEVLMLAPNEPERRAELLHHSGRAMILREIDRAAAAGDNTPELPAQLIQTLTRPSPNPPSMKLQYERGVIAGMILRQAINDSRKGSWKLASIKKGIASKWSGIGLAGASDASVQAAWDELKPVAHLWAAHADETGAMWAQTGQAPFPCREDRLLQFVARAEAIRLEGESLIPARRNDPLLDPETTWKVTTDLTPPDVAICAEPHPISA